MALQEPVLLAGMEASDAAPGSGAEFPRAGALFARAKINLALHVVGRRDDGYHLLDSLVAFAQTSDVMHVADSVRDVFTLRGPFAAGLQAEGALDANSVTAALALARAVASDAGAGPLAPCDIVLDKCLPVASGIGGGSADAAAFLRHVATLHPGLARPLRAASLRLGADVPMCFDGVPARVGGIGEVSEPLSRFPAVSTVLVHPGVAVSTPAVFRLLVSRHNRGLPPVPVEGFATFEALLAYLRQTRNDLDAAALSIAPEIGAAATALLTTGASFVRMSGSGATVFGLFADDDGANASAEAISASQPGWWIRATRLAAASPQEEAS